MPKRTSLVKLPNQKVAKQVLYPINYKSLKFSLNIELFISKVCFRNKANLSIHRRESKNNTSLNKTALILEAWVHLIQLGWVIGFQKSS